MLSKDNNQVIFPDKFISLFTGCFGLSPKEWSYFSSHFYTGRLKRNEHLLKAGDFTSKKTYILKGCTRTYQVDSKGNEHTLFFSFEDYWIGDITSYYTGKPSQNNVQAIENTDLLMIEKEDFSRLELEIPKLKKWYVEKVLKHHLANVHLLTEIKLLSPEERYLDLLKKQPEILNRVSQRHIANKLDIAPQSLSRIRARIMKKMAVL